MMALGWLWFAAVSAIIVTLAVTDWRRRLVANSLVVPLTALAAVFVAVGESDALVASRWWAAGAAAIVFLAGLGAWTAGLVGGGDVKLLAPVALIMLRLGSASWLCYLGVLIVSGVLILAVVDRRHRSLPLAPMLGLGVIPALLAAPPPWFAV